MSAKSTAEPSRTNEYLDHMNVAFFRPHGLYALIMCYKPTDTPYEYGDSINKSVARRVDGGDDFSRKSGTVKSELELPDAAPLVFPELKNIPDDKRPNAAKRALATVNDYSDRRARANFVSYEICSVNESNLDRNTIIQTRSSRYKNHQSSPLGMAIRLQQHHPVASSGS